MHQVTGGPSPRFGNWATQPQTSKKRRNAAFQIAPRNYCDVNSITEYGKQPVQVKVAKWTSRGLQETITHRAQPRKEMKSRFPGKAMQKRVFTV